MHVIWAYDSIALYYELLLLLYNKYAIGHTELRSFVAIHLQINTHISSLTITSSVMCYNDGGKHKGSC